MVKKILSRSIFVQILLATLLPLIIIFSLVVITISRGVFQSSAGAAQEKALLFASQSAEQIQSHLFGASRLTQLTANGLALMMGDSDEDREAALEFVKDALRSAPNAYRIRMYFKPGKDAFGGDRSFAHVFYHESGDVVEYPLTSENEPELDLSEPWYSVPLEEGVPYHEGVVRRRIVLGSPSVYAASTNYPVIRNEKVIGCVGMGLLYRKSFQFVDQWETKGDYRLLIINEKGTVLYSSDDSLIDRNLDSLGFESDFLEDMKTAMQGDIPFLDEGYSPILGRESLICVYPVDLPKSKNRIFVYTDIPTELVYSGAVISVWNVVLTFLMGLLFFIGSLFVVTKNTVKPIKRLTEKANLIANGQLDVTLDEFDENNATRNEIYSLGSSLQKMLKELTNNHNLKIAAMRAEYEKAKMEESTDAKNRFFANMSHEIRTPMNVILGMSEVLLMEDLTREQKKFVQDIKISSENLLDIINDTLDMSHLESGKLPLSPAHYDFRIFVENICSVSRYLAGKKGLDFQFETIGDMPDFLYGDDGRLHQVLLNIIGNAVKFTEKGGVTLTIAAEDETLRFDIADTGIGIHEKEMQHIFEPFKQVEGHGNHGVKGTGLGLSICLNLVELMNGAITIDSKYGRGTSFHVTIPKILGDSDRIENKAEKLPISFDSRTRVLVVDDSESNRKVALEFLKMFGIVADTASSGAEAIAMAAGSEYDLVFMDHMMPKMDGVETTHRIRALGDQQTRMPIIALTANAVIGSRELLLASGIDDFLAKPIEKIKFQAILAKWLPENLVIRESHYALGSRFSFRPEQMEDADGKTNGNKGKKSSSGITRILARVSELKELDMNLGLNRMAGSRELYRDLLGMISEMVPVTLGKIDAALAKGVAADLTIEIHTLKGSLANLGVLELAEKAAELEHIGNQANLGLFAEKLKPFRRDIEAFAHKLGETLKDNAQLIEPKDGQRLEDGLRELCDALAGFDYGRSMEIITVLARFDWGEDHNSGIKVIRSHIRHFDYDVAMNELQQKFPWCLDETQPT